MIKKEFLNRLVLLNMNLVEMNSFVDLYIAGGMAIAFNIDDARATVDVDVFNHNISKKIIKTLAEYDINTEISEVVRDKSYLNHANRYKLPNKLSNINLFICNNSYLFVLKNLAIISPFREYEDKIIDHADIKNLYKLVNEEEVHQIIAELHPKTINEEEKKYLIEEVEKWMNLR